MREIDEVLGVHASIVSRALIAWIKARTHD
jgi:hypothetical protein